MELIEKSRIAPALNDYYEPIDQEQPMSFTIEQIEEVINQLPTVDAAPVVHGRWEWDADGYLRCSECNQKAPVILQYQDEPETVATNYCPKCAAKMDL